MAANRNLITTFTFPPFSKKSKTQTKAKMTAVSTLSFKCALITGGGGIGAKAYYVLDVSNTSSISSFIKEILSKHPELDCLINNAGVQRPFQILGPDYGFDLNNADQEIDTNIRGPLHLSVGLVPHFNSLPNGGVIMNVSSVLGYNPFSIVNPVYNGTKSWLHFFTMNLRTQLRDAGSRIKVVEIVPPTVETALHRERKDPDDNKKAHGNEGALSVEEFMEQVVEGWKENRDVCAAGMGHEVVEKWYEAYGEAYSKAGG
jgi:short-subunit dehydrogenase involved in D-alanine esterification of teichoic acids